MRDDAVVERDVMNPAAPDPGTAAEPVDDEYRIPRASAEVSVLLDVGTAWSKASVVGRARGRWRVVAHAAQPTAWGQASLLAALVRGMRAGVDQRIVEDLERIIAAAPRITCHTPARPGRIAIASVTAEVSGDAARRAAESAGWVAVAQVAADDGRSLPQRLMALSSAEVDAWLVTGGFDVARPEQALEAAGMVAAARQGSASPVIWAGSAVLAEEVAALFEPGVVATVPNPRPTAGEESLAPLRQYLEGLLDRFVEAGETRHLSPIGFRRAVAEVAREDRLCIGAVDLGARYATWVLADGSIEPMVPESRIFASGGLASPVLAAPGASARLVRLLPVPLDELVVADTMQNMRARPGTLPYSDEALAVARAAGQVLLGSLAGERGTASIDLLIGAGRLIAAAPTPMQAMQLLLDGIRPAGVTQIAIDPAGILGPLGSLADDELREGIGILRDDLLTPLGTTVVVNGGRAGQPAMIARLHRAGWPDPDPITVRGGHLAILPLPRGERAELQLELGAGVTLPGPRRSHHVRFEVTGGTVGLVLDARGIPVQLPRRLDDRRTMLASWQEQMLREPVGHEPGDHGEAAPEERSSRRAGHETTTHRWRPRAPFLRNAGRAAPTRGTGAPDARAASGAPAARIDNGEEGFDGPEGPDQ